MAKQKINPLWIIGVVILALVLFSNTTTFNVSLGDGNETNETSEMSYVLECANGTTISECTCTYMESEAINDSNKFLSEGNCQNHIDTLTEKSKLEQIIFIGGISSSTLIVLLIIIIVVLLVKRKK